MASFSQTTSSGWTHEGIRAAGKLELWSKESTTVPRLTHYAMSVVMGGCSIILPKVNMNKWTRSAIRSHIAVKGLVSWAELGFVAPNKLYRAVERAKWDITFEVREVECDDINSK